MSDEDKEPDLDWIDRGANRIAAEQRTALSNLRKVEIQIGLWRTRLQRIIALGHDDSDARSRDKMTRLAQELDDSMADMNVSDASRAVVLMAGQSGGKTLSMLKALQDLGVPVRVVTQCRVCNNSGHTCSTCGAPGDGCPACDNHV
jgi:uncharacterized iron-regulated protein